MNMIDVEIKKGSFDTLAAAAVNFASFRQFFPAKYYFVQTIKKGDPKTSFGNCNTLQKLLNFDTFK